MQGWRGAHSLSAEDAGAWAREFRDVVMPEEKRPERKLRRRVRGAARAILNAWRARRGAPRA